MCEPVRKLNLLSFYISLMPPQSMFRGAIWLSRSTIHLYHHWACECLTSRLKFRVNDFFLDSGKAYSWSWAAVCNTRVHDQSRSWRNEAETPLMRPVLVPGEIDGRISDLEENRVWDEYLSRWLVLTARSRDIRLGIFKFLKKLIMIMKGSYFDPIKWLIFRNPTFCHLKRERPNDHQTPEHTPPLPPRL